MTDPATAPAVESPEDLFGEDLAGDASDTPAWAQPDAEDPPAAAAEPEEISTAEAQAVAAATEPAAEKPKRGKKATGADKTLDVFAAYLADHPCVPVAELVAQVHGGDVDATREASAVRVLRLDPRFVLSLKNNRVFAELAEKPAPKQITVGQIARAAFAAVSEFDQATKMSEPRIWNELEPWENEAYLSGVGKILDEAKICTASHSHSHLYRVMMAHGWQLGPEFDRAKKITPLLCAWSELPKLAQARHHVFNRTVRLVAFLPQIEEVPAELVALVPAAGMPANPAYGKSDLEVQASIQDRIEEKVAAPDETLPPAEAPKPAADKDPTPTLAQQLEKREKVVQAEAAAAAEPSAPSWKVGEHVVHEAFGLGKVEAFKGEGDSRSIVIAFEKHGTKDLMLVFAGQQLRPPVAPAAVAVPGATSAPKWKRPATPEALGALELELRQNRDALITNLGQEINRRRSSEQAMRSKLSESMEETKERIKELLALTASKFSLDTELNRLEADAAKQQKLDFAPKATAPAAPKDPRVIEAGDPAAERKAGAAAAIAGKLETDNPFSKEVTPGKRAQWFTGYFDQLRSEKGETEAIRHGHTAAELEVAATNGGRIAPGKVSKVFALTVFEHPCYVLGSRLEGTVRRWYIQPLLRPDEWDQLYLEKYGRPVEEADQNAEAKAKRQAGGVDCGRVVRVGKAQGKKYVVAPREMVLVLTTPDAAAGAAAAKAKASKAPVTETGTDEPPKDNKQRAAGD